ncbi:hypothetical protein VP01_5199g3 [Puccinia sorghi]|uniref:Uncharacterized protein n=1 Tax=Puccinia sorghi TaxID=27349 RepID=A0A0L6UMQ7_9BASI|nr:hypothetical protein VP01_5199g3 [Puccinia sorghi]
MDDLGGATVTDSGEQIIGDFEGGLTLPPACRICRPKKTITQHAGSVCGRQAFSQMFSPRIYWQGPQAEVQEQESVEWILVPIKVASSAPHLAALVGNHPAGIAEVPLFSELETHPSTVILHSSSMCPQRQEEGHDGQEISRAINSTSFPIGSLETNSSAKTPPLNCGSITFQLHSTS